MRAIDDQLAYEQAFSDELNRAEGFADSVTLGYLIAVRDRLNTVIGEYTIKPHADDFSREAVDAVNAVLNCDRVCDQVVNGRLQEFDSTVQAFTLGELHHYLSKHFE